MTTNEQRLTLLQGALHDLMADMAQTADKAMEVLEMMNPTADEYRRATADVMRCAYVAVYLGHIMDAADTGDYKKTENMIRFHAYQLRTKGTPEDTGDIPAAQRELAGLLDRIVKQILDM